MQGIEGVQDITFGDGGVRDRHYYRYGLNGLDVDHAHERAFEKVMPILERGLAFGDRYSRIEEEAVSRAIRACLLAGVPRSRFYPLAGEIVADQRDAGAYRGKSLALVFAAALRALYLGSGSGLLWVEELTA